ncbi:toxin [Actinacidiphila acididurans]|uniref:Toxin n=1 Tax=Actinacidiphila acididurans TaxID=2784346 RepID=A0ABS2TW29_9ACTN|nr:toxin [Actinacidiphila acididurans]MBM9506711.1 toxin [Actinacidiphila acididurans]
MVGNYRSDRRHQRKRSAGLLRACKKRLDELDLPVELDITKLVERISDRRGRPIVLMPITVRTCDPSGLWIATAEVDLIGYQASTSRHHQEHIIAHELGHMICCHHGVVQPDDRSVSLLFPDLAPDLVRELLQRTGYSDAQEEEAEITGSLLAANLINDTSATPAASGVLGGLESAWGFR